jgi:hypothetical protein
MGLLDDAIREHLELKRRRGADEAEVTRQETEALGAPQQRAEFAEAPAPTDAAAPAEAAEPEPLEPEPEPLEEPEAEIPLDQPTVEYAPEPESEPEPQQPPESDDVLEETPDFLQETPEHDRLWFEQKPPRDFDLDR